MPKIHPRDENPDQYSECQVSSIISMPSVQQLCEEICGVNDVKKSKRKERKISGWMTSSGMKKTKKKLKSQSRVSCELKRLKNAVELCSIEQVNASNCSLDKNVDVSDKIREVVKDGVKVS